MEFALLLLLVGDIGFACGNWNSRISDAYSSSINTDVPYSSPFNQVNDALDESPKSIANPGVQEERLDEPDSVSRRNFGYSRDTGFDNTPFGNNAFGSNVFGNNAFGSKGFGNNGFGNNGFGNNGLGNNGFGNNGLGNNGLGNNGFGNNGLGNNGFSNNGFGNNGLGNNGFDIASFPGALTDFSKISSRPSSISQLCEDFIDKTSKFVSVYYCKHDSRCKRKMKILQHKVGIIGHAVCTIF
ncbi:hypothetical protein R5R35_008060 [Gryllus longicercus]|uniref:Accessory gland protein n=1 Tax=Gryllus longicercus TaxID=2509291 RepID=A0AAN9VT97_9ORTH